MKRLFWITVGAGTALYAQRRAARFVKQLAPQNIAVKAVNQAVKTSGTTGDRLRSFAGEVRFHAAEREAELREAIELDQTPPEDPRKRRIIQATPIDESKDGTHGVG
ncbi:hypothetical protein [Actinocorallia longicatena]|uniref:Secreted protein n=1 Tax=Actinocorallia longicatena TaxID=111803 RepID=A0ABP6Q8Q5_9ACTN